MIWVKDDEYAALTALAEVGLLMRDHWHRALDLAESGELDAAAARALTDVLADLQDRHAAAVDRWAEVVREHREEATCRT